MFLYNNFINLNNTLLTQSCEYVKEMIEYEISAFSKLGKSLEDLPLEVTKAEFCPYCGTKNPGGNFCLNCGKNLLIPKKKNK